MLEQKNKWHTTNDDVQTSHFTQLKMLPNDNVSMSVGHLDHVIKMSDGHRNVLIRKHFQLCKVRSDQDVRRTSKRCH